MKIALLTTGRHDMAFLKPIMDCIPGCYWLEVRPGQCADDYEVAFAGSQTMAYAANRLRVQKPTLLMVVGDRTETLAICVAATCLKIPIAHLHGGEVTLGAIDNVCRHAISQLATLHFCAHAYAADRLHAMNVPGTIRVTGSPSLDLMFRKKRVWTAGRDVVFSYHPTTLGDKSPLEEIKEAVAIVTPMIPAGGKVYYTGANPDAGGKVMNAYVQSLGDPWIYRPGMTPEEYWDLLCNCAFLAGNSSSGIIEAPALGVPVVNIGNRQAGRIQTSHGDGHACERIATALAEWQVS